MSKQEKTAEPVEVPPVRTVRKWNVGSVFWGLLFVLVGTLLLLDNLGFVTTHFANIWQLWPVLIIGAGLSLLSLRGWIGGLVSFVAAIALLGLVTLTLVDNPIYPGLRDATTQTTTVSDAADGAKQLQVTIDTGAADITLSSSRDRRGVQAIQESTQPSLAKSATTDGDKRSVVFSTDAPRAAWLRNTQNSLAFDFTRSIPVALSIDTGATSVSGDLSQVRLSSLAIDTGASSIDLRLGMRQQRQEITLDGGASKITLHIPKQAGVRVESSDGLTQTDFEGLDKVSDSRYESSDFDDAKTQITIRTDLGVSRFEIQRY